MSSLIPTTPPGATNADATDGHHDRLWTVTELARFLSLHPKTVYAWVARGSIPHIRLGRRVVFSSADIGRWIGARREGV